MKYSRQEVFPSVSALYSLALYSNVCCQNLFKKILTTFRTGETSPFTQVAHIWYNIKIDEVLFVQTTVIRNYERSIL